MLAEQADVLNMNFVAYMGEIRTDFVWKTLRDFFFGSAE
jgi:hypothetical protein